MNNYLLETHTYEPWENLATETHLAGRIRTGDFILYLWQNDHTVVIGRNQNALRECRAHLLEEEGGYLARRTTGGGAVYHDLGNLCFTFVASPERYDLARQMKVVQTACAKFGIRTKLSGRNDIVTEEGCKFSGCAFSVTKKCLIQHGTLMIHVDKEKLGRYLTPSREKIVSKGVASVKSRVCNLQDLNPDMTVPAMRTALREAFEDEYGAAVCLKKEDLDEAEIRGIRDKYASWEWRYGKSPKCETSLSGRFDWGEVEIFLSLKNMTVDACKVYSDALDTEFPELLEQYLSGRRYDGLRAEDLREFTPARRKMMREVLSWLSGAWR